MKVFRFLCPAIYFFIAVASNAQDTTLFREKPPSYDSLKLMVPFLNLKDNSIKGDTGSLSTFFQKLDRIASGSNEQAVVVHIGDSHIQPGVVTQPTREWLQSEYGNAGRGLMFPYRLAKSNGPSGYVTHCDTPWVAGRNATIKRPLPTGIAGFTIWTANNSASFTVEFTTREFNPGDTGRLVIFHSNRDTCSAFSVTNELTGRIYPVIDSLKKFQTTFRIEDQPQKIRVRATRKNEMQKSATFYGMSLESARPGVIVHSIGVNGAMFTSYLESEYFVSQLAMLKPDLLIFSLGTNEAFSTKGYSSESFRAGINLLLNQIRQTGNEAAIILTTPPGIYKSYRKKRRTSYKPNPLADTVANVLRHYAVSNGLALWDWYTIMGGRDAMAKWKAKGMTDRRYIHFSGKGYGIQGLLMKEAIVESYEKYKSAAIR
jgi:hypothetical protein